MYHSYTISYFFLTFGLAAVFIWFGIDKFLHPSYWIGAWMPEWIQRFLERVHIQKIEFIYANAVFEIAVGIALISGIWVRFFALLAAIFLLVVILTHGFNEVLVRDVGLFGGFLAVFSWPRKKRIKVER